MDWITGIQNAIDYIEDNITEEIDYDKVAAQSFSSSYHFQRVFSILCGFTVGEYIRCRRLSLAGSELASGNLKIIDAALKYGYESPDGFARAFQKFHGITPSAARQNGSCLKSYSRLVLKISLEGGSVMDYRMEERPEMVLTGYKQRFTGVPFGADRERQEENLFVTTRGKQWLLRGAAGDCGRDICVVTNITEDGYDFYYAQELDAYERDNMYNYDITGIDNMESMGFENLTVPKNTYVVFTTEESIRPISEYCDIRKRIVSEWLPSSGYQFADAPEVVIYHWKSGEERTKRYIEVCMPIEKAK